MELKQGAHVVVGNEEAGPAVEEVMAVEPTGVVRVRVLPGPAEDHLHFVQRADVKA